MGGAGARPQAPGRLNWTPRPRDGSATGDAKTALPAAAAGVNPGARAADADEARARAALAAARENLTEKLVHYTPAHPDVRAAEADVQRATERLAAITGAAANKPPAPVAEASATPADSTAAAAPRGPALRSMATAAAPSAPAQPQNLVELETEWLKLTRAVTEARQRQDQIEAQLFRADIEVSSERGGHGVQVNVIDPAFFPQRPLPPGPLTIALIFLAASLVVGALGALIFAAVDERVFAARDAAGIIEVLAEVPKNSHRRAYVAG
jgi:hypothetical protein